LQDYFPLTGVGFVPVSELAVKNKEFLAQIKAKLLKEEEEEKKKKKKEDELKARDVLHEEQNL
jgi:hypothetical protein